MRLNVEITYLRTGINIVAPNCAFVANVLRAPWTVCKITWRYSIEYTEYDASSDSLARTVRYSGETIIKNRSYCNLVILKRVNAGQGNAKTILNYVGIWVENLFFGYFLRRPFSCLCLWLQIPVGKSARILVLKIIKKRNWKTEIRKLTRPVQAQVKYSPCIRLCRGTVVCDVATRYRRLIKENSHQVFGSIIKY